MGCHPSALASFCETSRWPRTQTAVVSALWGWGRGGSSNEDGLRSWDEGKSGNETAVMWHNSLNILNAQSRTLSMVTSWQVKYVSDKAVT